MGCIKYLNKDCGEELLKAKTIVSNNNSFFNISIGNKEGWEIRYSLDSRVFKPKKENDILHLKGNNFILKPILKDGNIVKDKLNNDYYVISKINNNICKKDSYVFWDTNILESEFKIVNKNNITILAKGKRLENNNTYISLVLEVFEKGYIEISDNLNKTKISITPEKIIKD